MPSGYNCVSLPPFRSRERTLRCQPVNQGKRYLYMMRLSAEYCSSRPAPVLPIAFPAAELPFLVPIAHKLLPALLAYQRVICFFVHLRLVCVPPPHPAPVRAEFLFLPAFVLHDCLPALLAGVGILRPRMPPQIGLHCIQRQAQHFCDCSGTFPLLFQAADPDHIFIRHIKAPPHHTEISGRLYTPSGIKYLPPLSPHYTEIWAAVRRGVFLKNFSILSVDNLRIQS